MGSVFAFLIGVAERIAAGAALESLRRLNRLEFLPLNRYKSRLLARMAEMPFLYKDMKLSAKDDFVEPLVGTAVTEVNESKGNPNLNFRRPFGRFRETRRAIIFGQGGFGKTTLIRHIIIRCLQRDPGPGFLGRRLVPVFVALKTVKTSSDYPILDAIQRSDSYFDGARGMQRLRTLARRRRLLLFLDGFDEMAHVGGISHVKDELATIFGKYYLKRPTFFEAGPNATFYIAVQECRVYLSSRQEFFAYNGFAFESGVERWTIKGFEDRRIELVDKIFENYGIQTTSSVGLKLDAELFMQQLQRTGDNELHTLSRSPLFLTVMCFVYVQQMRAYGKSTVFDRGAFEIINECIVLLISELDQAKAKGLPAVQRQALLNRRSAFPQEKLAFLQVFAVELYKSSGVLFDKELLKESARAYFRSSSWPTSDEILRGLEREDPTSNIVDQIILSGIFVLVDRHREVFYYDFPHRRFRETLAVSYFNNEGGAKELAGHLTDSGFSELILVYLEQSEFSWIVLDAMVANVICREPRAMSLLVDGLDRLPRRDAERSVESLLSKLKSGSIPPLASAILSYLPHSTEYVTLTCERLARVIRTEAEDLSLVWLRVLATISLAGLRRTVIECLPEMKRGQLRACIYSPVVDDETVGFKLVRAYLRSSNKCGFEREAVQDVCKRLYFGQSLEKQSRFVQFLAATKIDLAREDADSSVLLKQLSKFLSFAADEDGAEFDLTDIPPAPPSPWLDGA